MESNPEKVNFEELTKNLRIDDPEAFTCYLKDVYNDLYSRVIENKNDPKEKQVKSSGVTKIIFDKYYELPGIIGDRLFGVLIKDQKDQKDKEYIKLPEFQAGLKTLFCANYDKVLKFIFDFYDFDNDGKINKEDIRVVLSYMTLADSPDIRSAGTNLSYRSRVSSQEELFNLLQQSFKIVDGDYMNFDNFKKVVENVNSDIFLMIYMFLLENKPFTKDNVNSYKFKKSGNSATKLTSVKENTLIASPSKTTNFSPYKNFSRKYSKRRSSLLDPKLDDFHKMLGDSPGSPIFRKRKAKKKKTLEKESGLIKLQDIAEEGGEKKLDKKRIKDLAKKLHDDKNKIEDKDIQIKPAYKQDKNKKLGDNPINKMDPKNFDEDDDDIDENEVNFGLSSDDEESEEEEGEVLKYEGYLYKLVDNKMRKLFFKLVHKDLYYYKNEADKAHKGMHNLTNLYLQEDKPKVFEGKTYYSFSIAYPAKTRTYYCDDEKNYKEWVSKFKQATGYTNLLDLYEIKQKLGNGKFGLVKLGKNKQTGQEVAIKIMNKQKMDTSDIGLVRTEIEILKICQHPNIIRLYDIFENADYIYIIMEYCKGGDLFSYLEKRHFRLSEERASNIMHKMCVAVYYIHSFGVIHRDLKPENVLMTSEEDDGDIRILDFGLSKIIGSQEKCTEPYGTLTYCAPEIILDVPYSKEVDLWSLGVMTYLMLSGRLPFNAQDETEIAQQVAFNNPDFTKHSCWASVSSEAKDFIKKLLEKDPKKRMDIKSALEHNWIKKYDKSSVIALRRGSKDGKNNFEMYSSIKEKDKWDKDKDKDDK